MRISFAPSQPFQCALAAVACALSLSAQSFLTDIKSEHDPGKRIELALSYADESFDSAKAKYRDGNIHQGDVELDNMAAALNACVDSLNELHKARFYKKPELKVAHLQRCLADLVADLNAAERGWAEQTERRLEEIHSKMLEGVMRK